MKMRLGAPLLLAMAGLFGLGSSAQASHCGCTQYAGWSNPCCDAQCCFTASQAQTKASYRLVYDTVTEKRFHVCHQTVCETVMRPVCKTCYRTEQRTCYKQCCETCYKTEQRNVCRPVCQTVMKECHYCV